MTTSTEIFTVAGALLLTFAMGIMTGSPEQEKAFTDKYKGAIEGRDSATLESFFYTQGSDPDDRPVLQDDDAVGRSGERIASIELVNLTREDIKKASTPMDSPGGGKVCLPTKPTKKLVIKVEREDGNDSSSSTSESFVAENGGKFVIPVPGPCR